MSQETKPQVSASTTDFRGERSRKVLKCVNEAVAYQKTYLRSLRDRVAEGEPVVWKYVITPEEIFKSMDILNYDMQHYSALCSAKQMSEYYLDKLNAEGYFRDLCRYCTVPLGYAFDKNNDIAPWGGLPKFVALVFIHNDDPALKIWELYAREFGIPMYQIDFPYWSNIPDTMRNGWGSWRPSDIETHRVDAMVEEFEGLFRFLETITGKHLSITRLRDVIGKSNQIFEYYGNATNLAGETVPCPISWTDALANLPAMLWFPGTQFGVDQARKYYEEVKERVDHGLGVCEKERVRIRWYGIPQWFSLGFYNAWEENYGAVFLPCGYYEGVEYNITSDLSDPIRALATRTCRQMGVFRIPCTNLSNWHVHISKRYKSDGVIFGVSESCKLLYASILYSKEALEKAGIPTLDVNADMVDARDWDDTKMKALVTDFIETLQG